MTPWPPLTEKCFCNSFPLQRRESTDTRQICWNGKIGKLEKAFRPVFDLSCFSFLQEPFMKWVFDPWTKPLSSPSCFPCTDWPPKTITGDETGVFTSARGASFLLLSVFPHSFRVDLYFLVSLIMCESTLNESVEFWIRVQIAVTELLTCLSTGWKTMFHIDLSWAKAMAVFFKHNKWEGFTFKHYSVLFCSNNFKRLLLYWIGSVSWNFKWKGVIWFDILTKIGEKNISIWCIHTSNIKWTAL